MEENDQNSQTLFPHETGHGQHRSARQRQRQGPMWGCLKALFFISAGGLILLFFLVTGGWWYLGSQNFADLVARRVAETLKTRLGREVSIGRVVFDRAHLRQVALEDVRIANAPGAVGPYFATMKRVVITGGVNSFWRRSIKVGRIDLIEPHIDFEIYPAGSKLTHNFPHWSSGPPSKHEIVRIELGKMFVKGGAFTFNDRRHQITAVATDLGAEMTITSAKNLYAGVVTSPRLTLRIQDYVPVDLNLRGGFRFTPGRLELQSIAIKGRGLQAFVSGAFAPLSDGVYNLRITAQADLERVREIFRVNKTLKGVISLDTRLRGTGGTFTLNGGWVSPGIVADSYELTDAKGKLDVNGDRTTVEVESARYGGGTISAHYILSQYAEPYPMNVELRYNGISIEKLFDDWTIPDTGLNGGATGHLAYHWNKDKILEGAGTGTAELAKNGTVFSGAKYRIPIGGSTDFTLDNGVVTFRRLELDTAASHISATGTLRIEDVFTNLQLKIHSTDFSDLDRAGFNFAHSAGKRMYTLLGLGGSGDVSGTVKGKLKTPQVVAHITGSRVKYNNVLLGNADIDLHYDGVKFVMTFDRAIF
ncbi:MAG: AsmA family protein, partial [Thermoanaerobaculia bacterium]